MPDPVWTSQYSTSNTPENNGYTRRTKNSPTINEVRTGTVSNRRVEINSTNGEAVFETTNAPALNSATGATLEVMLNVSGTDAESHAGCELTFSNRAVIFQVHPNACRVTIAGDNGTGQEYDIATAANNSDILWRATYSGTATNQFRLYRAGTLVAGPYNLSTTTKPSARILWWVEAGATATFKAIKTYVGGAVAPG